jgi:hypothetical protein
MVILLFDSFSPPLFYLNQGSKSTLLRPRENNMYEYGRKMAVTGKVLYTV